MTTPHSPFVLAVCSVKGGTSKSTVATNLGVALTLAGVRTIMVDADTGAPTTSNFCARRTENPGLSALPCVQMSGNMRSNLTSLASNYDAVIVDVGGNRKAEIVSAGIVANVLITPFKASIADLDNMPVMVEMLTEIRAFNAELKAYALLAGCPTNPLIREEEAAKELLAHYPDYHLLPVTLHERKVYRDALLAGKGDVECDNPAAKTAVQMLAQLVASRFFPVDSSTKTPTEIIEGTDEAPFAIAA